MKNPLGKWNPEESDRQTGVKINWEGFHEIQKIVGVSLPPIRQSEKESWIDHHHRLKNEYLKAASEQGYKMLGRIWYEYDDAVYFSSEILELRDESFKAKTKSQSPDLITAMDKILVVCDDALRTNSGLLFGCD